MKKYLLAIGLALLQTTFSMARDHAPAQNEGFEKEDYISQENRDFANTSELVGARNAKVQTADIMQRDRDEGCNDDMYDTNTNDRRWGRKKVDDTMNGDNCCKPKCPKPCCPKPKCCKPKCCPKPPKTPCCPKPKCPKPKCCKPCEPMRQPACTQDGCCEPRRLMQCEKPKCCKPKTCCKRKPKCCDQDMMMDDRATRNNNRNNTMRDRNNMMNPRDRSATRDM